MRRAGAGADRFFLDDGAIAETVRERWDGGADKVLELIGTTTLRDSLRSTRQPGTVCMTGMVGDRWSLPDFAPMDVLPTAMSLTTYTRGVSDFMAAPLQELVDQVANGALALAPARVFHIDDIVEAHRVMRRTRQAARSWSSPADAARGEGFSERACRHRPDQSQREDGLRERLRTCVRDVDPGGEAQAQFRSSNPADT